MDSVQQNQQIALMLPTPNFLPRRFRPGGLGNWSGHLAFANDLIASLQPSLLVELGTHFGESYFGMCQSVLSNRIDCVCYAIDHWQGEEHAGRYGEEVYEEVRRYNDRFYREFSYLLRSSFDDALSHFTDNSIDLLHIDGLHTYGAAFHDFQQWLPKVKPGGVVLLHDVMARHGDFGVWRLWEELRTEFSDTFTFHHSWGLGILRKPATRPEIPEFFTLLFNPDGRFSEYIRRHYVLYSSHIDKVLVDESGPLHQPEPQREVPVETQPRESTLQVFVPEQEGYSEAHGLIEVIEPGKWQQLSFDLPLGISGRIRIDPVDCPCLIRLHSVALFDADLGHLVWAAQTPSSLKALDTSESLVFLPEPNTCQILSLGSDPQIFLPHLELAIPARLDISLCLDKDLTRISEALLAKKSNEPTREAAPDQNESRRNNIQFQLFPFDSSGYSEEASFKRDLQAGRWHTLSFEIPPGGFEGPIRIDPSDSPCVVHFDDLRVLDAQTDSIILHLQSTPELRGLLILSSALYLPEPDRCLLFCTGQDPQLQLIPPTPVTQAVRVEASVFVDTNLELVAHLLQQRQRDNQSLEAIQNEVGALGLELKASQSSSLFLSAELTRLASEKAIVLHEKEQIAERSGRRIAKMKREGARTAAEKDNLLDAARAQIDHLHSLLAEHGAEIERQTAVASHNAAKSQMERTLRLAVVSSIESSRSWKLTKPLRDFKRWVNTTLHASKRASLLS